MPIIFMTMIMTMRTTRMLIFENVLNAKCQMSNAKLVVGLVQEGVQEVVEW